MVNILVIPDSHATPAHNNSRFDLLGQYIVDKKPDIVVNIGDWADMQSLSSYDRGKKSFEGRRYKVDIEAAIDAQIRMFKPIKEYNKRQRENKQKQYKPRLIHTTGNHDWGRINRIVELQPELEGAISVADLKYEEFGWEVYPYGKIVFVEGVAFCHTFPSGVMGKPIGGEHHSYSLISKMHHSCVAGHSHLRDFAERTTAEGKRLIGLIVGCYMDEDHHEPYAASTDHMWWRGLVMLHNVKHGEFDPEFISMKRLRSMYAKVG